MYHIKGDCAEYILTPFRRYERHYINTSNYQGNTIQANNFTTAIINAYGGPYHCVL